MNVDGGNFFPDPGGEIVDPNYKAVTLSGDLQHIRAVLFGIAPDRHMLNYRVRQFLNLLHSNDLKEFVTDLDNRITYTLADDPYTNNRLFEPEVVQTVTGNTLYLFGNSGDADTSGRMKSTWDILVVDGDTVQVTLRKPLRQASHEYTITSGLSSMFPILGSDFTAKIRAGNGASWIVSALARPSRTLSQLVVSLQHLREEPILELFMAGRPEGQTEPMKTFRNMWEQHFDLPHKLGGILLALIYHTEDLRQKSIGLEV